MTKEHLYQPYEILAVTVDKCPKLLHQHSFFELVYILEGTGRQYINESYFDYQPNHMFLLTPQDTHSFDIYTTTSFFFLQFNDTFIRQNGIWNKNLEHLEYILQNVSHKPGCILRHLSDKKLVRPMVEALIREKQNQDLYNQQILEHLVNTLIVVVARNIAKFLPETVGAHTEDKAMEILQYIHQHVYEPEKLRAKIISDRFGVSETYLGRYFKKHTDQTLQNYINNYRVKLIAHRLRHSDMRIGEIAFAMGFTDESHLNKFFKKSTGFSPVMYRKENRPRAVVTEK